MKNNPSSSTQQLSSEKIIEDASKLAAKAFLKTTSYIQVFRIQNNEILFEQMLQIIFPILLLSMNRFQNLYIINMRRMKMVKRL